MKKSKSGSKNPSVPFILQGCFNGAKQWRTGPWSFQACSLGCQDNLLPDSKFQNCGRVTPQVFEQIPTGCGIIAPRWGGTAGTKYGGHLFSIQVRLPRKEVVNVCRKVVKSESPFYLIRLIIALNFIDIVV